MRIEDLRKGVSGLKDYLLNKNQAPPDIIKKRREICKTCKYLRQRSLWDVGLSRCGICGCFIKAKTALITESCPKGYF